ncbi:unnamed protein product [Linum tenue]|uniref:Glycosyl transferase family 1 domain-containing protein n=1 Tax=Linum tenue TaxID=586396 RepID=A0AAV0JPJ3_9ROSI|nr:unnamed protein product [Linum tenue]
MFRYSQPPEVDETAIPTTASTGADDAVTATTGGSDQTSHSIRDRLRFKRNPNQATSPTASTSGRGTKSREDRAPSSRSRWHHHHGTGGRRKSWFAFRGVYLFYFVIVFSVLAFAIASVLLQSSVTSVMFSTGWSEHRRSVGEGLRLGTTLKFVPGIRSRPLVEGQGLDQIRMQQVARVGLRAPRLAIIYASKNSRAQSVLEQAGGQISILPTDNYSHIDWSMFDGIIVDSLQGRESMSSLMQEPFCSIPVIWIIQEDALANRLPVYEEMGWTHLMTYWRSAFSRASVVVFPDFTLPMLYSVVDPGNFFVIPGSPVDVWAADIYRKTHDKHQLRMNNGFDKEDIVVLVVGSSFFYNELSWDYAVAMHTLGPLLAKYARRNDAEGSFKFVFLCGNSTDGDAIQEVASRLGLIHGSVRHYGLNGDVSSVLLMADIVLYGSSQDEQGFPPLIIRAMTFGIPVLTPEIPIMKKYVSDESHVLFFPKYDPEALMRTFSLLISDGSLSKLARTLSLSGRLYAKDMLASECVSGYAKLLENILSYPSDTLLPASVDRLQQITWEWSLFGEEIDGEAADSNIRVLSVVQNLETEVQDLVTSTNTSGISTEISEPDGLTKLDWDVLDEIESSEEFENVELEQFEERMDKHPGIWDEIYRNARKAEKLKFEANERDEGELERTGQPVCIYEIYSGAGAWPFLHHGSLYRGLSLSTKARRSRSDDVDAVARLPLLNDTYYRDILCELGGMFSIANKVDEIHKRPWIGFQSWRATGRKVSLSPKAEKVLEEKIQRETVGDVVYFWTRLDKDYEATASSAKLGFWSICDLLNAGHCRTTFENAFRQMYSLPSHLEGLPPMPEDGGHWSALHSWVMPTPSFLEFTMFSRMFVDSLDSLQANSGVACMFSSSEVEEKHCYCRIMELLVNVWAYHSGRKMVYIDPETGSFEEQHSIEERKGGVMWAKYMNLTLLKSMDEDLAEAADDGDLLRERWLWPLTGEVHWQGIYERERVERYRQKMDKKRKNREKLSSGKESASIQTPFYYFTRISVTQGDCEEGRNRKKKKKKKKRRRSAFLQLQSWNESIGWLVPFLVGGGLYAPRNKGRPMRYMNGGGEFSRTLARAWSSQSRRRRVPGIRLPREERKAMVESFVKQYQQSNNGKFSSLTVTRQEVGGSPLVLRHILQDVKVVWSRDQAQKPGLAEPSPQEVAGVQASGSEVKQPAGIVLEAYHLQGDVDSDRVNAAGVHTSGSLEHNEQATAVPDVVVNTTALEMNESAKQSLVKGQASEGSMRVGKTVEVMRSEVKVTEEENVALEVSHSQPAQTGEREELDTRNQGSSSENDRTLEQSYIRSEKVETITDDTSVSAGRVHQSDLRADVPDNVEHSRDRSGGPSPILAPPSPKPAGRPDTNLGQAYEDVKLHYTIRKELGWGQFRVPSLCIENSTGKQYVCQSISKRQLIAKKHLQACRQAGPKLKASGKFRRIDPKTRPSLTRVTMEDTVPLRNFAVSCFRAYNSFLLQGYVLKTLDCHSSIMHAIKGGWVGQTFALSKSNESGGRKSRIRRSKEERKGMVELFIKKYQSLNNGNFPSLNLTHKEVGGSFYTVREIVREIIQENRVLGPAKFLPEEQDFYEWSEQYPLGTISTEPQPSSAWSPNGTTVPTDQRPSSLEEFSFSCRGRAEIHDDTAETGQIINANFEVVGSAESDQQMVNELHVTDNEVASIESILVPTDASIDNHGVKTVSAEVQAGGLLENKSISNVVGYALQDDLLLEVGESYEQMNAAVEIQAIGTEKNASVADAVTDVPALEVEESDQGVPREVQALETEKSVEEVPDTVLLSPSLEVEEFKEQIHAELQVKVPGKSAKEEVGPSRAKVFEIEDVVVETFPLPTVSRIDGRTSKENDVGDDKDDYQNSSLLERKSTGANEQESKSPVGASVVGSELNTIKEGIVHDRKLGVNVKPKLSNGQASTVMNRGKNAAPNATSASAGGHQESDIQASVSGNKANVGRSKNSQKRGDPALDRINIRSWQRSSRVPPQSETNPLWAAFQAFVTAFVKFWSE